MTAKRNPETYPPEFFQLFVTAKEEPLELALPARRAYRLRQQLYEFRAALRHSGHEFYQVAQEVVIRLSLSSDKTQATLILENSGVEIRSALAGAGVQLQNIEKAVPKPGADLQSLIEKDYGGEDK